MRFNTKTSLEKSLMERPDATLNKAGGIAFTQDPKTELFLRCATLLPGEDKFYASGKETASELRMAVEAVMQEDPEFVLKLAAYLRSELYMRHAPLLLVAEYARAASIMRVDGAGLHIDRVKNPMKYVDFVIRRADEIPDLMALCLKMNKDENIWLGKVPMLVKRGVASAFNKFDEYQFAKYGRQTGIDVTMRDALFMAHPKAKDANQQAIFDKIASNSLEPPATWEEKIMVKGSTAETWGEIIPYMGYMALLRNLRNFVEKDVPHEMIHWVAERIANPEAVARSKQFPFRFYSAHRALKDMDVRDNRMFEKNELMKSVLAALELSAANIPKIPGRSVIFIDVSGSMTDKPISRYSSVTPKDIATLYGSVLNTVTENAVVGAFATDFAVVRAPGKDIFNTKDAIDKIRIGGSTNAWKAFEWLRSEKIQADRVYLLSDMQHWNDMLVELFNTHGRTEHTVANGFMQWVNEVSPNAMLYSIDLVGYGTASIPDKYPNVVKIAGWSEKIFQFVQCVEQKKDMVDAIEKVDINQ